MRRREVITLLGGAATWPLAASAQQGGRMRRIGVLMVGDENDPFARTIVSALTQALADLGWADGRNARMDIRWAGGDDNRIPPLAKEARLSRHALTPCRKAPLPDRIHSWGSSS
jgi:putative ABC transport system substrate-binding protein